SASSAAFGVFSCGSGPIAITRVAIASKATPPASVAGSTARTRPGMAWSVPVPSSPDGEMRGAVAWYQWVPGWFAALSGPAALLALWGAWRQFLRSGFIHYDRATIDSDLHAVRFSVSNTGRLA